MAAVVERPSPPVAGRPPAHAARLAALVLDWLVLFIVGCILVSVGLLLILVASDMGHSNDTPERVILLAAGIAALTAPAWLAITLAGFTWRGQSAGKLAMNLRVVGADGRPPGLWRGLLRLVVYALECLPLTLAPIAGLAVAWRSEPVVLRAAAVYAVTLLLPVASLIMALRDSARRALHDQLAGTRVVQE